MGYVLAFFLFGGGNVFGTVQLILSIFKIFLPVFILFSDDQTLGRGKTVRKMGVVATGHSTGIHVTTFYNRG